MKSDSIEKISVVKHRKRLEAKTSSAVDLAKAGMLDRSKLSPTKGSLKFTDQGQLPLHAQNIAALQKIVDADLNYYATKYKQDPVYRQRMREIYAGQLQLKQDIEGGSIDLPEIRQRLNQLATMNMRAHNILDDGGQFTETAKSLLLLAADVYTLQSRQINLLATLPNITRVSISLGLQMLKYGYPGAAAGIQFTQWGVNLAYCAVQFAFTLLLPIQNGVGQPRFVRAQTFLQPVTPNVSSNEPKMDGVALLLRKPSVVQARLQVVNKLVERWKRSPAIEETRVKAEADTKASIERLTVRLVRKVNKEGARLQSLDDLTPHEAGVVQVIHDPIAAAKALLLMKDTTRIISPQLRDKLTFLVEEIQFWTDLQSALLPSMAELCEDDAASGDDSSADASPPQLLPSTAFDVESALGSEEAQAPQDTPVPAGLLALRARLVQSFALMEAFSELNEQTAAGSGARRSRNYDNALSALLSLVPNITSLTGEAASLANFYFGFFMDTALLFSLVRQPWRYDKNLPKDMAKDLESKLIRLNQLLFLLHSYAAEGPDGGPDPKQLDRNMVRTAQVALKQLEEALKYDLQLKSQAVLSYFVDVKTLNPRKAKTVEVAKVLEEKGRGGTTFRRSSTEGVLLPCTFSRLNAYLLTLKSRHQRLPFIEDLCNGTKASDAVRHSVHVLLDQYENTQIALKHLADKNLAGLFDDELLTPQAQQMLAKSLMYAQHRTDIEESPGADARRFDEHELDLILAGVKELCSVSGKSESRTLMACFQILQKQIINGYGLFLAGPGGFTFLKAVFTLMATLAEIYNKFTGDDSRTPTVIKLVGNLFSLFGSMTTGIVIASVYGLFIALKNQLRNEFKSDPNNVNIAGVSYATMGRGMHLSLDYMQNKQTNTEMLVTPGLPPVEAPPLDTSGDFASFFTQFVVRFRPEQAEDTEQDSKGPASGRAQSKDPADASESSGQTIEAFDEAEDLRIPMEDDVDEASGQARSEESTETASADDTTREKSPPILRAPVPPLLYENPIRMWQEFLLGTFTTVNFLKWREYLNAKGAELADLPDDERPGWMQAQFTRVMALVKQLEAQELSDQDASPIEVGPSGASDSSSSSPPDMDLDDKTQAVMQELVRLKFVSYGVPFTPQERKDRVQAVLFQFDELTPKTQKNIRQKWREQAHTLQEHIDQLDPDAPLRQGHQQSLDMMEELLKQTRATATEQRKKPRMPRPQRTARPDRSDRADGPGASRRAADARRQAPGGRAHSPSQAARAQAQRAGFVSTDKLDKAERRQRVASEIQRILSGPPLDMPTLMAHWTAVHKGVVDLLNEATSRNAALEEFQWTQAAGMVLDLINKLQKMQRPARAQAAQQAQAIQTTQTVQQSPARSAFASARQQLSELGLWQEAALSSDQAVLAATAYVNSLDQGNQHRHLTLLETLSRALLNIDGPSRLAQLQIGWTRLLLNEVIEALEEKILAAQAVL